MDELAVPLSVPSVTEIVVVSAFFNVVVKVVVDCPLVKFTDVTYDGAVNADDGPLYDNVFVPVYDVMIL